MSEATIDGSRDREPQVRDIEGNLKSRDTWIRLVFMLVYWAVLSVTGIVATAIIVLGVLVVLFTGARNEQLRAAGEVVADYIREILRSLTFTDDSSPFRFGADVRGRSKP